MVIELVPKSPSHSIASWQLNPSSEAVTVSMSPIDVESSGPDFLLGEALYDSEWKTLLPHPEPKTLVTVAADPLVDHMPNGSWLVPLWLMELDRTASGAIHTLKCGCLDYLFFLGAKLFGDRGMFLTIVITIPILGWQGMYFVAVCSIVTVVLIVAMKKYFRRPRPAVEAVGEKRIDIRQALKSYSFPSGDSAQAGSFAMSMYLLRDEKLWGVLSISLAVWGRVYFGCHYISDCVCGTLLGLLVPWVLWEILSRPMFSIYALGS